MAAPAVDQQLVLGAHFLTRWRHCQTSNPDGQSCPRFLRQYRQICKVASNDISLRGPTARELHRLCEEGPLKEALEAVEQQQGFPLSRDIAYCLLQQCSKHQDLAAARRVYSLMVRNGLDSISVLGDHLIRIFASSGRLPEVNHLFYKVAKPSIYTWTAIISAHAKHGRGERALELYHEMQQSGVKCDKYVYIPVLKACATTAAIEQGRIIHEQIIKDGLESNIIVGNALLHMYAACGNLDEAHAVFDKLPNRSVVTWGTMIAWYAQYGNYKLARQCFEDMQQTGLKPNHVIFTNILVACSRAGLVNEGRMYLKSMEEEFGITPRVEHYNCMIDLLGRAGRLNEANDLLRMMPTPSDVIGWRSLLTACRKHNNVELGKQCFDQVARLDPSDGSGYMLMSHIYADAQMWKEVDELQELRKSVGAWKKPGRAYIEVDNKVHEFTAHDRSHPKTYQITRKLKRLSKLMKKEGYVPQLDQVLQPMSDKDKEDVLCWHCEKLAVAFGLISTPGGSTIRVTKNMRVCMDCHNGTKIISKIEKRDIIIRDAYCIHHFKNGACSCGDNN